MATYEEALLSLQFAKHTLPSYGKLTDLSVIHNRDTDSYNLKASFEKGTLRESLADPVFINNVRVEFQEIDPPTLVLSSLPDDEENWERTIIDD